ncbi:extracellular solute-binding protein [Cellvibrio japonicus]|uniref:Bacterial extracellular solute-binding protein, family 5 domain protein n=1 Tax=Cellvibrio japonicus (strain Ueda107) TaxID=498211 RepID=B3PJD7_CELJU|nr:extracellular solute-binding protein [Cellvibrio japonicus]ACE82759.1 Bacterial extracellular solute-binding protein, family 5 domain protein [Cellvibrio japonicus Ueda107]QEI12682.1 ABC transporter substrate-binding protein [Cellvibrio japonicus]QEI16256.1 ABC transporter substrate-binding protein [Cellvibrio japonicus]QEI19834.1 ABC transporter substrate-binding protein [Cellvibrio japonicus]
MKLIALLFAAVLFAPSSAWAAHALAFFGEPKYPAHFSHFDYVNPDAPKGGSLVLSLVTLNSSFDKFNPYSLRGVPAPGLVELVFETLTVNGLDELNTQYGLLADDIEVAPDFGSTVFRLHPKARFSNGDPVTARDVEYSFRVMTSKAVSPRYSAYFSEIDDVEVIDERHIRFVYKRKGRDLSFIAGSLPVFSSKWGQGQEENIDFADLRFEKPVATGPYIIELARSGRDIIYTRNPDYWGRDIPVQRGSFNFDRIVYKLYKDRDTQVAALRAGDYDFLSENQMRYWCCQYIGKRFDTGEIQKRRFLHANPPAMNGWVVNTRKERFQDIRVRKALNYALDFEWINDKIFDGEFSRIDSYFSNTRLAATGYPSEQELAVLEPWRDQLPPEVFGPMFVQPTTVPPLRLRDNLDIALQLLAEAGWHYRDGVLQNDKGEPFVIEVAGSRRQSPFTDPIYRNLAKIGIQVRNNLADAATLRARLRNFDFDYTSVSLREARMPGDELWRVFNSAAADRPGSENLAGVKSPVVDALIKQLLNAESQQELETLARALDRVLIHNHYFIPWRYLKNHYVMFNQRLQYPDTLPLYYAATDWAVRTWWDGDADKDTFAFSSTAAAPQPHITALHMTESKQPFYIDKYQRVQP